MTAEDPNTGHRAVAKVGPAFLDRPSMRLAARRARKTPIAKVAGR